MAETIPSSVYYIAENISESVYYVAENISMVERKTMVTQTYFLKPLFRGNLDPFVNNANLGAIAHTSNGT